MMTITQLQTILLKSTALPISEKIFTIERHSSTKRDCSIQ